MFAHCRHLSRFFPALLHKVETTVLAGIILFSALLLFVNVVLRYAFLHPIFWADELARYLMVWMIFLGAGKVAGGEGHVSVTILADRFPSVTRRIWDFTVTLLCLIFCVLLAWYSLKHTLRVQAARQTTAALELPMWLAYLSVPVGAASMALRYGCKLANAVRGGRS